MAQKSSQAKSRPRTLFQHGFFHKYAVAEDSKRRDSESPAPSYARPSPSNAVPGPTRDNKPASRQTSTPRTPNRLKHQATSDSAEVSTKAPASPLFKDLRNPPVSGRQEAHINASGQLEESAGPQSPRAAEAITMAMEDVTASEAAQSASTASNNLEPASASIVAPRSAFQKTEAVLLGDIPSQRLSDPQTPHSTRSSSLSAPPSKTSALNASSGSSRKRKRTPIAGMQSTERSPSPTSTIVLGPSSTPSSRGRPTSSLSSLSATPAFPNTSQTLVQAQEPPTASQGVTSSVLSTLSTTPIPPTQSQRPTNVGDSQSDDELEEEDVYEEERPSQVSKTTTGSYCAPLSDDSDDLEDFQSMFGLRKNTPTAPIRAGLRNERSSISQAKQNRYQPPRFDQRKAKSSFAKLLKESKREGEHLRKIEEAERRFEAEEAEADSTAPGTPSKRGLLESLADNASDEEKRGKIRKAIDRQELLTHDSVWHFFDPEGQQTALDTFPTTSTRGEEAETWSRMQDPKFRDQAFLSGFATDWMLSLEHIDDLVVKWLWQASVFESRVELRAAYRTALASVLSKSHHAIHSEQLMRPLICLGANREAISGAEKLRHVLQPINEAPAAAPKNLINFLQALRAVAADLPAETSPGILCVLLRLGVDRRVGEVAELLRELRNTTEAVIKAQPLDHLLASSELARLVTSLEPASLQKRMLSAIADASPQQHELKRRLALAFFLSDPSVLQCDLADTKSITEQIVSRLRESDVFDPEAETVDYRMLSSSISILDTAIGAGFGAPVTLPEDALSENQTRYKISVKAFNAQIDEIANTINSLYTQIQDTGASHMLRTTAKSTIQNLELRLNYGVRFKPPPRRDAMRGLSSKILFGASGVDKGKRRRVTFEAQEEEEQSKQARIMDRFLDHKRRMQAKSRSPSEGAVGAEEEVETASQPSSEDPKPAAVTKHPPLLKPVEKPVENPLGRPATQERQQPSWKRPPTTTSTPAVNSPKPQQPPSSLKMSTHQKFLERKKAMAAKKSPLSASLDGVNETQLT